MHMAYVGAVLRLQARKGVAGVDGSSAACWISGFLTPEDAELARIRLEAKGITAVVDGSILASADPPLQWSGGGVTLMVEDKDLDAAMEALRAPEKDDELPAEFDSPPDCEEKIADDGASLSTLLFLLLVILLSLGYFLLVRMKGVTAEVGDAAFVITLILSAMISFAVFRRLKRTNEEE